MGESRHFLNGQQVEEPVNWQDLEITLDFSKDALEPTISLDNLDFVGDTAKQIIALLETNGYYQGIEYRIDTGPVLSPSLSYQGYLDPTSDPVIKACDQIQIALKKRQGADWLVETADSFSFRYLSSAEYNGPGKIVNSDYTGVPYIINHIPNGTQLILLSISSFLLTKQLIDSIKSIAKQTTDVIEGVTPTVGTSVGLGAGVVTAWPIGKIIGSILKIAIEVAFAVSLIVGLVKLIEEIIEQLAPKKRFHLGMGVKDLALKACEHLGLTLKSDLLDSLDNGNKWVVIPSKSHKGGEPPQGTPVAGWVESGVPSANDGIDTFGDLIRFIETTWNADYKLKDGVLEIERKDFWSDLSSFVIPDTLTNQDDLRNEYTFNTSEIWSNYVISWSKDLQDQNTLSNLDGLVFQAVTGVKAVQDIELVNLKGLKRVSIPMSMAVRKNKLTAVEEVLKAFLTAADFLSGQLDSSSSFAAQFSARIGSMHLSSHFLSRPKMVVMAGSSLALEQRQIMSAQQLWEQYHYIETFVTIDNENNQQLIYKEQEIPFCNDDFVSLVDNNFVTTTSGEQAKITNVVWSNFNDSAIITYRVFRVYDDNLEISFLTE